MSINAFTPQGKTCLQTANIAGALPTPIQVPSFTGLFTEGLMVTNGGSNGVFIGYGPDAATATANAVAPTGIGANSTTTIVIPQSSVMWIRIPPGSFLCCTTGPVGTSGVYFTPGEGS